MADDTTPSPPRYLGYLDAARGIAACMVMVYHYINWKYDQHTGMKLASMLFNGSDAVSFFFVLSGFVLSYKYIVLQQPLDIKQYYITRFFRLWPAYFLTIVINVLYVNRADLSLHNMLHVFVLNRTEFWENAALIRYHVQYFTPGWTLVIELMLSLFIPFWVVLAKKDIRIIYWVLITYLLVGNSLRDLYMFHFHFTLGVLISCLYVRVTAPSFRGTRWYRFRYFLLAVAAVLFSIRHIDRISPLGSTYTYVAGYFGITYFHYTALAAFVFIIAIINSRKAQQALTHRLLLFLGRISYGIYLMHWVFVVAIFDYWDSIKTHFPATAYAFTAVFCVYAAATLLSATVLHYAVELPFIRLGKRITRRLKPSVVIR